MFASIHTMKLPDSKIYVFYFFSKYPLQKHCNKGIKSNAFFRILLGTMQYTIFNSYGFHNFL